MFYGGRLASHLSNAPDSPEISDFISLRRLNRRGVMLMDSDRDRPRKAINETKRRLRDEFDTGPGHAWITGGREIENYLLPDEVSAAVNAVHPTATPIRFATKFDRALCIRSGGGRETVASKVDIARHICKAFKADLSRLDLRRQIAALHAFIVASNPKSVLKQACLK